MLTPQNMALVAVLDFIKEKLGLDIKVGTLPADGGISAEVAGGYNRTTYLDKQHQRRVLPIMFLSKSLNQLKASDDLYEIENLLSKNDIVSTVQILSATSKSMTYVGQQGDFWIYSMIVDVEIYY